MQTASTTEATNAPKNTSWTIDGSRWSANSSARHSMVTNALGEFGKMSGSVTCDPAKPDAK